MLLVIYLVLLNLGKWVADPESVGQEGLAESAELDVFDTVYLALDGNTEGAKFWVAEYYRRTKGNV